VAALLDEDRRGHIGQFALQAAEVLAARCRRIRFFRTRDPQLIELQGLLQ
jgi:hypothetical protein